MFIKPIITDSIDSGIDRKCLKDLQRRLNNINSVRLKNTRRDLSSRQKPFLDVLPLLLHTNHPLLPGYISHQTPAGIIHYEPSAFAIKTAKRFGKSFCYNPSQNDPAIDAIFIMGSVGTIAYSNNSDLDVWVCYSDKLSAEQISLLDKKCSLIEKWAEKIGLEAHLFTMNATEFSAGKNKKLSKESSGNFQHFLLLDEFYRSAITLAGKTPSWWFVPANSQTSYDDYLHILLSKRFLPSDQVLDFGEISNIPFQEFISAGIWQLYKAIDAPYKSLIKLLLLESYANQSSSLSTISDLLKQIIYGGDFDTNDLDPYIMSYRYIEQYLISRNELERLHLIRRCMYLKINIPLSRAISQEKKSWRRRALESLVKEWEWTLSTIKHLDNRLNWKAFDVLPEQKNLVTELNNSYQFLMQLADPTEASEPNNELRILQRKLNAYYNSEDGKIEKINANISDNLSEEFLTFIEVYDKKINQTYWCLYADRVIDRQSRKKSTLLKKSPSIVELILWSYFNNILTSSTHIDAHAHNSEASRATIYNIMIELKHWLPLPFPTITHAAYKKLSRITDVMILINADQQPISKSLKKDIHHITSQSDILNHGVFNENLIRTIDIVTRNNWNEITHLRFSDGCIMSCVSHFLSLFKKDNHTQLPALSVICHTPTFGNAIQHRVTQLFNDLSQCFDANAEARFIFSAEGHYYLCQQTADENISSSVLSFKNDVQLIKQLGSPRVTHSSLTADAFLSSHFPLELIASISNDHVINLLYSLRDDFAHIFLLDELGTLYIHQMPAFNEQILLRPLHHFIRSALSRLNIQNQISEENFNIFPVHFYRLNVSETGEKILERNHAISNVLDLPFFNVKAIISETILNKSMTTSEVGNFSAVTIEIQCDKFSFNSNQCEGNVFSAAAQHIVSQRQSREKYPCYITDIDLSNCSSILSCNSIYSLDKYFSDRIAPSSLTTPFKPPHDSDANPINLPSTKLQLVHYFAAKSFVERQLNAALSALPSYISS